MRASVGPGIAPVYNGPMEQLSRNDLFRRQAFIGGVWRDADKEAVVEVTNPATRGVIDTVPNMGKSETNEAIEAASAAFRPWADTLAAERGAVLRRWAQLMGDHQADLARIMTIEQGKPLAEASGEIAYAASFLTWFAEEARRTYGRTIPTHDAGKRIITMSQPVGVVGAITPWNFPSSMITRKAGPALAAGCPIIIKPASQTPFSALALAVLAEEAGVPPGVFQVVTGDAKAIGGALTKSETVRKLTFTGSTEVGRKLLGQSADTIKKVSMELGGNAPFLVFDDADVDAAVAGAMTSKFRNTGQTCVCTNRFYVQRSVYDAFADGLVKAADGLVLGNGLCEDVTQGPLIDEAATRKMAEHVEDALDGGASAALGGGAHALGGTFWQPTVLIGARHDMAFAREETFGPLAALIPFDDEEEAVAMANDTEFGLAAYFYARDIGRVWRVAEALESGMVGANTGLISTTVAPFGGVKQSGLGREGGPSGIDEFLETKYLCLGL